MTPVTAMAGFVLQEREGWWGGRGRAGMERRGRVAGEGKALDCVVYGFDAIKAVHNTTQSKPRSV